MVVASLVTRKSLAGLDEQQRIAAIAFESHVGMLVTDADNVILRVNRAFTDITGYSPEEIVGKSPKLLKSGRHDANFYAVMWRSLNIAGAWKGEILNRRKNGEIYPEYLNITAVKGPDGVVAYYVAMFNDIAASRGTTDGNRLQALYDPLTGLPNRRLLLNRLLQAFASSACTGRRGALLIIDLDNFKTLNDTLGHNIGDMLLKQAAQRLEYCVREDDTVARLWGDEFAVMIEGLSNDLLDAAAQVEAVGDKIRAALIQPYRIASQELRNTPCIGATIFCEHEQSREELLKQADIALHHAKKAGRNTLRFFDPHMQEEIYANAALESELHRALEESQFRLHYQVQVDGARRPLGAEALIRWQHDERGLVSPVDFIPLAEETGLIVPIGRWVLETACAQIKQWERHAHSRELVLAVNVSARQIHQADFVSQVQALVQGHAINPALLKLELTESMLLEDIGGIIDTMNALKEIGVQLSLDDFGTGYSSLQYLKRLPLDQLKIDQSFVRDITFDNCDRAIVRTIIAMANSLDLEVIAEGVETEAQFRLLLSKGCTRYQGFFFGKPVPAEEFEAMLENNPGADPARGTSQAIPLRSSSSAMNAADGNP